MCTDAGINASDSFLANLSDLIAAERLGSRDQDLENDAVGIKISSAQAFLNIIEKVSRAKLQQEFLPEPHHVVAFVDSLGIESDKSIIEHCLLDLDINSDFIDLFIPSIHDAGEIYSQEVAIKYIATLTKNKTIPHTLPTDVYNYLNQYRFSVGQYVSYDDLSNHEFLKLDSYLHITSPIRRLVDLLNITILQHNLKMVNFSPSALQFYNNWLNEIDIGDIDIEYTTGEMGEWLKPQVC